MMKVFSLRIAINIFFDNYDWNFGCICSSARKFCLSYDFTTDLMFCVFLCALDINLHAEERKNQMNTKHLYICFVNSHNQSIKKIIETIISISRKELFRVENRYTRGSRYFKIQQLSILTCFINNVGRQKTKTKSRNIDC